MPSQSTLFVTVVVETNVSNGKPGTPDALVMDAVSLLCERPWMSASRPPTHCGVNCQLYPICPPPVKPRCFGPSDVVASAAATLDSPPKSLSTSKGPGEAVVSTPLWDQLYPAFTPNKIHSRCCRLVRARAVAAEP